MENVFKIKWYFRILHSVNSNILHLMIPFTMLDSWYSYFTHLIWFNWKHTLCCTYSYQDFEIEKKMELSNSFQQANKWINQGPLPMIHSVDLVLLNSTAINMKFSDLLSSLCCFSQFHLRQWSPCNNVFLQPKDR